MRPSEYPTFRAAFQHNLDIAYADLRTGDHGANLARAIECFQEALPIFTPQATSHKYAVVQYSLGSTYYSLPTGDRGANLTQAIECFQEALRFLAPEATPLQDASIQNALGNIYRDHAHFNVFICLQ